MTRGRPKGSRLTGMKRMQACFPASMFAQIRSFAATEYLSIKDAILRCIKLGLFLRKQTEAGNEIFIERNGVRTKIMIID